MSPQGQLSAKAWRYACRLTGEASPSPALVARAWHPCPMGAFRRTRGLSEEIEAWLASHEAGFADTLSLSTRARAALFELFGRGDYLPADFAGHTLTRLQRASSCGDGTVAEIRRWMASRGARFATDTMPPAGMAYLEADDIPAGLGAAVDAACGDPRAGRLVRGLLAAAWAGMGPGARQAFMRSRPVLDAVAARPVGATGHGTPSPSMPSPRQEHRVARGD